MLIRQLIDWKILTLAIGPNSCGNLQKIMVISSSGIRLTWDHISRQGRRKEKTFLGTTSMNSFTRTPLQIPTTSQQTLLITQLYVYVGKRDPATITILYNYHYKSYYIDGVQHILVGKVTVRKPRWTWDICKILNNSPEDQCRLNNSPEDQCRLR